MSEYIPVRRPPLTADATPASSEFVRKYVLLAEALAELHALDPLDETFVQQYRDAAGWLYQAMSRLERVQAREQIAALRRKHRTPWWRICSKCDQDVRVRVAVGSDGVLEYRAVRHNWRHPGLRCPGSGKPTSHDPDPPEGL